MFIAELAVKDICAVQSTVFNEVYSSALTIGVASHNLDELYVGQQFLEDTASNLSEPPVGGDIARGMLP